MLIATLILIALGTAAYLLVDAIAEKQLGGPK